MTQKITNAMIQRPVWWPVAAVGAVVAFFAAYIGIAVTLDFLFLPQNPETVQLMADSKPTPKSTLLHSMAAMFLAFGVGEATYTALRGDSVAEALGRTAAKFLKVTIACGIWIGVLFSLLWMIGLGGAVGAVGMVLLPIFILVSLAIFASYYKKHTPPYPETSEK